MLSSKEFASWRSLFIINCINSSFNELQKNQLELRYAYMCSGKGKTQWRNENWLASLTSCWKDLYISTTKYAWTQQASKCTYVWNAVTVIRLDDEKTTVKFKIPKRERQVLKWKNSAHPLKNLVVNTRCRTSVAKVRTQNLLRGRGL